MKLIRIIEPSMDENTLIYFDEQTKDGVIIDPGARYEDVALRLNEHEIKPFAVLLTHGHFDHTTSCAAIRERLGAKIFAGEDEAGLLGDPEINCSINYARPYSIKPDRLLKDGEEIKVGGGSLRVIKTPGHTSGSVCYYDEANKLLFAGDTLFFRSIGRTDFPTGSYPQIQKSIRERLYTLPEDTRVVCGHGEDTSVGGEKSENPYV